MENGDLRPDENGTTEGELAQKSYRTILKQEIVAGLVELKRPGGGLFLSSLSAGLNVGFSLLLMASMLTLTRDVFPGRGRASARRQHVQHRVVGMLGRWNCSRSTRRWQSCRCSTARRHWAKLDASGASFLPAMRLAPLSSLLLSGRLGQHWGRSGRGR